MRLVRIADRDAKTYETGPSRLGCLEECRTRTGHGIAPPIASIVTAALQVWLLYVLEIHLLQYITYRVIGATVIRFWRVVGYWNPNCPGEVLWSESGTNSPGKDVPRLAASYSIAGRSRKSPSFIHGQNKMPAATEILGRQYGYQPNPVGSSDGRGHSGVVAARIAGSTEVLCVYCK